jgi:hypothetical protein
MQNSETALAQLADAWVQAKHAEAQANAHRVAIEEEIIAITGAKDEGRETHTAGTYKIVVIGKLTYKADITEIETLSRNFPDNLKVLKTTIAIDEPKLKKLREFRPDLYKRLSPALTVKPAKTGIQIESRDNV